MLMRANKRMMVLRVNQYKSYDIIKEHNKISAEIGYVWILKMGKPIPEKAIDDVIDDSGILILKMPKSKGGDFYYTKLTESCNGNPKPDYVYPPYYNEMVETPNFDHDYSLSGTWLRVSKIKELPLETVKKLVLVNTGNSLIDVVNSTRTSFMYVRCDEDIIL